MIFSISQKCVLELTVINGRTGKTPKCCDGGFGGNHPNCLPIEIPKEDHFYKLHQRRCMNFVRSQAGLRYNCRLGPREQFNEISAVLDAGTVYSNVPERLESLRYTSFEVFGEKNADVDFQVIQERFHEDPSRFLRVQHERSASTQGLLVLQ